MNRIEIHTAQYRWKGLGRLDVTVKSAQGWARLVAPTWQEVLDFKKTGNEEVYLKSYIPRLEKNIHNFYTELLNDGAPEYTFVCFCPPGTFCHRVLIAERLQEFPNVFYMGERRGT